MPALNLKSFIKTPSTPTKDVSVNLLPQDAFSRSPIGRVLTWSLSTGRYIVVFTEMIVILTFLSRFTLDRQLTDLNESILKKQAIIESFGDLETNVRQVQAQTEFIRQLQGRVNILDLLDFLTQNAPNDISLDNLSVQADGFSLESVAYSTSSLKTFTNIIQSDPRFSDVSLGKINTSENDTGIEFSIRAKFSQQ